MCEITAKTICRRVPIKILKEELCGLGTRDISSWKATLED